MSRTAKHWRVETPNIPSDEPFVKHIRYIPLPTGNLDHITRESIHWTTVHSHRDWLRGQRRFQLTLRQKPVQLLTFLLGQHIWVTSKIQVNFL